MNTMQNKEKFKDPFTNDAILGDQIKSVGEVCINCEG